MLRQFRLESLLSQAQPEQGLGRDPLQPHRAAACRSPAPRSSWAPAPGRPRASSAPAPTPSASRNLHNWWLETYADGGLVGFALHFVFFLLLVIALWPIARHDPDPLTRYLACGTWLALLGWTIGSVGPSSSVSFAPMWILYGLGARRGLALAAGARSERAGAARSAAWRRTGAAGGGPPVKVLVISHLYPSPGVERHLFVHEQLLALRELGVEPHVISPTPYAPRILWRDERQRRRGEKPREAVRDGITAEYPRVLQPPKRLLFDRLGDLAYRKRLLAAVGDGRRVGPHPRAPGAAGRRARAAPRRRPARALGRHRARRRRLPALPHGRRRGAARQGACSAPPTRVMANSSAVAGLLDGVVAPEKLTRRAQRHDRSRRDGRAGGRLPARRAARADRRLPDRAQGHPRPDRGPRALLRREGRTVHLAVAGDGPLRGALEAQAAEEGVADTVHFLGRVPHARVLALMARAQLVALPSWDEAFGLVYTEAMAQGTPVVAGKGEGPEDFITDGVSGYLVPGSLARRAGEYHRGGAGRPGEGGGRSAKPAAPPPSS